jgi:hypothetical protein
MARLLGPATSGEEMPLIVAENWFEELSAKMVQ